jgi:hypothetical protein
MPRCAPNAEFTATSQPAYSVGVRPVAYVEHRSSSDDTDHPPGARSDRLPFSPPPGLLILAAGALFVALARMSWAPAVGSAVQLAGVLVATVAGLVALRKPTVHT